MLKFLLLAGALCALSGCATAQRYHHLLTSWMGESVQALHKSWGPPSQTVPAVDGGSVLVYERGGSVKPQSSVFLSMVTVDAKGAPDYGAARYGQGHPALWCRTYFQVNSDQTIVGSRAEGNNCISR